jgi:lysophospholipase L1-like esterase
VNANCILQAAFTRFLLTFWGMRGIIKPSYFIYTEENDVILSFEQIKAVTVGALSISADADAIRFSKCTEAQKAAWLALNDGLGHRALTTTGIRLDFHTDAKRLTFTVGSAGKYDVDVNGLLRAQLAAKDAGDSLTVELSDPIGDALPGEARVTLCLPSHSIGSLRTVELEGGERIRPHAFDRKFLFLGDSITQGWETKYDSLSFAYRVSSFFNADSVIQGIGGAYYHETTLDALPYDPDLIFVAYGTNDFGHYKSLVEFRAHVATFLDRLVSIYPTKRIAILSPIWRDKRDGKAMGSFADCRATIDAEARARGLFTIDGLTLVPPIPEFFADGYLHPNDVGFSLYAQNLIREIEKIID